MTPTPARKAVEAVVPQHICEAIAVGRLDDPFAWLGLHQTDKGFRVVCFDPGASEAWIADANGRKLAALERVHPAGVFAARLRQRKKRFDYRLVFHGDGNEWTIQDPYKFGSVLGDLDIHLLAEGSHQELYERLGAHELKHEGVAGTAFAVWAPNARRVSVLGDFNFWDGRRHPMRLRHGTGVWEIFLPGVTAGARYKFEIVGQSPTAQGRPGIVSSGTGAGHRIDRAQSWRACGRSRLDRVASGSSRA